MRRRLIRTLLVVVGIMVGLFVFLLLRFPPDTWKDRALAELAARTGIEATAEGASLSFPWPVGLKLSGVELQDKSAGKPYERMSARIDNVVVSAELMSLVRGAPHVREIRLARPELELWMPAESAAADTADTAEGPTPLKSPTAAVLSLLAIDDGQLLLHNADGSELAVRGLTQRGGLDLTADGSVLGHLEGAAEAIRWQPADAAPALELPPIEFALQLAGTTTPAAGTVEFTKCEVAGLKLSGPVRYNLEGETPLLGARLQLEGDLAEAFGVLRATMPPDPVLAELKLQRGSVRGTLNYAGNLPGPGADLDAQLAPFSATGSMQDIELELWDEPIRLASGEWEVADGKFKLLAMKWTLAGATIESVVEGPATGAGKLFADLDVDLDLAAATALGTRVWGRLPAEQTAGQPDPSTWPKLTGQVKGKLALATRLPLDPEADPLKTMQLGGELQAVAVDVLQPGWSQPVRIVSGHAKPTLTQVDFFNTQVEGPGFTGVVSGALTGWPERQELTFVARMESLDLDVALPALAPPPTQTSWRLAPVGTAWATAEPWVPAENLMAQGVLRADRMVFEKYEFTEVVTRGALQDRKLVVPVMQANLGGGALLGESSVDWTTQVPQWTAKATAEGVSSAALLAPVAGPLAAALATQLGGTIELAGPLDPDPNAVRVSLSGNGKLSAAAGRLLTEPIVGNAIDSFLGNFAPRFRELDFRSLTAGLSFDAGRVVFDQLFMEGPTSVRAQGWVGLDGKNTDTRLTITLPREATPNLGNLAPVADFLRDEQGRLVFDVALTGPAAKPKVQVDTAQLAQRARDRGESAVRSKLDQLVPEAVKPGTVQGTADSLASEVGDKLGKEAADLLKKLGRKKGSGGAP